MRKIILYSAASSDHYIARENGGLDWLENPDIIIDGEDYAYNHFYKSIGVTLIGNNTYKQIVGFEGEFPYPDKVNYVFTRKRQKSDNKYINYISGDIAGFCRDLKNETGPDIWLVGGGKLNTTLFHAGLIDTLILTIIPITLGNGIPLFTYPNWKQKFRIAATKIYKNGVIQNKMSYLANL